MLKTLIPKKIRTSLAWSMHSTPQADSYWANFEAVREIYQKRVTGDASLSWYTWKIQERENPFGRVLAFGDGKGMAATAAFNPPRLNIPAWHEAVTGQNELRKMALQEDEWISSGRLPPHFMYYTLCKR